MNWTPFALQLQQALAAADEKVTHNLSTIEGTFNQCDAILSQVRQEAATVRSQVVASPAVYAQDLNSRKRTVEEVKQDVAKVQVDTYNGINAEIEKIRGTILATSASMQGQIDAAVKQDVEAD